MDRPPFAPGRRVPRARRSLGRIATAGAVGRARPTRSLARRGPYAFPMAHPRNATYAALKPFAPLRSGRLLPRLRARAAGRRSPVCAAQGVGLHGAADCGAAGPAGGAAPPRAPGGLWMRSPGSIDACRPHPRAMRLRRARLRGRRARRTRRVRGPLETRSPAAKGVPPPRSATVRGFASERTARGGGISIPVGWFGNLDDATGPRTRSSCARWTMRDTRDESASVSLPVNAIARAAPPRPLDGCREVVQCC